LMRLADLVRAVSPLEVTGDLDVEVTGVADHSGTVRPGDLFVCVRGFVTDGHLHAGEAVGRGAAALVTEDDLPHAVPDVPRIVVEDSRKALGLLSSRFHGRPSSKLTLTGG